jgi:16S rRNA (cytosine1402-N4)-methyltransferase
MNSPVLSHRAVMLNEMLGAMAPRDGAIYVDGTMGRVGYTRGLLEAAKCTVYGIDRDPEAIAEGERVAKQFPGRLNVIKGRFGEMDKLLEARGVSQVDGITLDLGVSSPQIDDPARGFSFRADGPLDMRMGDEGPTAADILNEMAEDDLADIIFRYGEERHARRIARAIVAARSVAPITRTAQLAEIVRGVVRRANDGIDPATRTFQALRIYVNDELGELTRGLAAAERLLRAGGRLAVVSFHSLEDREVKSFLRARAGAEDRGSRHLPQRATRAPSFTLLSRRAIKPGDAECAANPRARSARLRAAERTSAPALEATP